MHPFVRALVLTGFGFLLAAPMLATIAGVRPVELENRPLEPWPDTELADLGREETYDQVSNYLVDRFPLRSVGIYVDAKLNDVVWREDTSRVVLGENGWLYVRESFSQLCREEFTVADSVAQVERLVTRVEPSTFLLAVVPAKSVVYPNNVPPRAIDDPQARCVARERARLRSTLEQQPWYVDLYRPLSNAADDALVFHPQDTHWNSQGALVATRTMIDALDGQLWDGTSFEGAEHPFSPDLARMRGLPIETLAWREIPVRAGVAAEESPDVPLVDSYETTPVLRFRCSGGNLWPGRTVIVHDSLLMNEDIYEQYVPFFADVTFIHWDLVGDEDVDAVITGADTLVLEIAERKFTTRAESNMARFLAEQETHPVEASE